MATSVGNAYIDLDVRTDGINRSIDKAGKGVVSKWAKIGLAAGAAFGGAIVVKGIKDSINAASDLNEAVTKSQVIFGSAAKDIERFSGTTADAFGISRTAALDASSTFATFGKAAGLSAKELAPFSTNLVELSADLASFYNTSPEDAIQALGSALRGESEPMRRYGVLLNDATLKEEALRQGIIKTTKGTLPLQAKVLAANAVIMRQTSDAQGDFARTSDGMANQSRILSANMAELKTSIGKGLLPVITKILPGLNKVIDDLGGPLSSATESIGDFLMQMSESRAVNDFIDAVKDLIKSGWEVLVSVGRALIPVVEGVMAAFSAMAPIMKLGAAAAKAIADAFSVLTQNATIVKAAIITLIGVMAVGKVTAFAGALATAGRSMMTFALGARAQTAATMGLAPGLTAAQAGLTRLGTAATFARTAFAAMGGPISIGIAAVGTLAAVIGDDLVASFKSGFGGGNLMADSLRNMKAATDEYRMSVDSLVSGEVSLASARTAQAAANNDVAAKQRALNALRGQEGTKAYAAAEQALTDAKLRRATATQNLQQSERAVTTGIEKSVVALAGQNKALKDANQAAKTSNGIHATTIGVLSKTAEGQEQLAEKTAAANKAVKGSGEWKDATKTARDLAAQVKDLPPKYNDLKTAADNAAKAKTPDALLKAQEEMLTAYGKLGPEAKKAVDKVTTENKRIGMTGGKVMTNMQEGVKTPLKDGLDDAAVLARDGVSEINRLLRLIGDRSSPVVASVVAKNLANINLALKKGYYEIDGDTVEFVKGTNKKFRKLIDPKATTEIWARVLGLQKRLSSALRIARDPKRVGEAKQVIQGLINAMKNEIDRRRNVVSVAMDRVASSVATISSSVISTFDRMTAAGLASLNALKDQLTATEGLLARRQGERAAAARKRAKEEADAAVIAAQAALDAAEAPDSGAWAEDIQKARDDLAAAKRQQDDALWAEEEYLLQQQANAERKAREDERARETAAYNLQRENMRNHFEATLAMAQANLRNGSINAEQFTSTINTAVAGMGVNAQSVAGLMGTSISSQFSVAMTSVVADAVAAAKAVTDLFSAMNKRSGLVAAIKRAQAIQKALGKKRKKRGGSSSKKSGRSMGVPEFAKGAVVNEPTLALIGETRRATPEIVTPERLMRQIMREEGGATSVRVFIGDKELTDLVRTEIVDSNRATSRAVMAGAR